MIMSLPRIGGVFDGIAGFYDDAIKNDWHIYLGVAVAVLAIALIYKRLIF